ncbi:MAG: 5'-methylthioadenosine/S-adenosylhomocysteine nucleosidase [Merdibacter sp.]
MHGQLKGREVLLMKSGVGKVAAALTTTAMEHYPIEALNVGTAGGPAAAWTLESHHRQCDRQYDYDTSALTAPPAKASGFQRMTFVARAQVSESLGADPSRPHRQRGSLCRPFDAMELIEEYPRAVCAEMEAGAIAQVCTHYQIPFVILRSLSDVAWKQENALDFETYKELASRRSAQLCERFVEALAEAHTSE